MKVVSGICDRISVLQRGAMLAEGSYAEVSANAQVMQAYMGRPSGRAGRGALMAAALEISHLHTWYGESHILHDVNLTVRAGEVVTLLGRNGAGRTTTLRAIMGLTGARKGSIKVNGVEAIGLATHKIAHLGIGYCPEERGIFSSLSTEENLMLPPQLRRRAGHAGGRDLRHVSQSGGTQAQPGHPAVGRRAADAGRGEHIAHRRAVAVARRNIRRVGAGHRAGTGAHDRGAEGAGYTVVMVEQNFRFAAPLADKFYVMEHGQIVETFAASELGAKDAGA